ncbi:Gfo/Idh/MocA family protein [Agrobacterium vitis]
MSKIFNVAVIGLGIGARHIREGYMPNTDLFRVATICDLDPARLAQFGEEFSVAGRTDDFDAVLNDPSIDIVDICTPPSTHYDLIFKALDAGKHVICEKPLVGSLAEIDRLMIHEKTAKGRVMPIFQYRYGDGVHKARRIIEAGLAGKAYIATSETHWTRLSDYYAVPWRGKWATELGGVLMTHAIHINDMLSYLLGPVASLYARVATRVNPIEVEDCVSLSLEMTSGALATVSATLGSAEETSRLKLCFEHVTFESSHAPYHPGGDPWRIIPANPEVGQKIDALLEGWVPMAQLFSGQMQAFHACLVNDTPTPVTTEDARRSLEFLTACYWSATHKQEVHFPVGSDNAYYDSWRHN